MNVSNIFLGLFIGAIWGYWISFVKRDRLISNFFEDEFNFWHYAIQELDIPVIIKKKAFDKKGNLMKEAMSAHTNLFCLENPQTYSNRLFRAVTIMRREHDWISKYD